MNNTFSMQRVMWYGRKHYLENARGYLYGLLGLLGLLILGIMVYGKLIVALEIMLMATAAVYCVQLTCRSHFDKLQRACSYTLPVTQTEKFLFMWFNTVVLSSVVILLIGLAVAWCTILFTGDYLSVRIDPDLIPSWVSFFWAQSAALLVCCWTKGSPIKGYLMVLGIVIGFVLAHGWFWRYFFDLTYLMPLSEASGWIVRDGAIIGYSLGEGTSSGVGSVFMGLWIPVFWVAAYFKFRERTLK